MTVQRALRTLTGEGLVEARPGVGTFVRAARIARPADYGWQTAALRSPQSRIESMPAALRSTPNDVIALHAGYPDAELLPERLVRAALTRAARGDAALTRSPARRPAGAAVLVRPRARCGDARRRHPARAERRHRAARQPERAELDLPLARRARAAAADGVADLLGRDPGRPAGGRRVVPVPSGPTGPDPAELARAFEETGARVFYAQPNYANPTGAQWPVGLHGQVLEVVRSYGAFVVEDDWAHDFGITTSATPVAAHDDAGHVVYLRSLTKSVSPSIRVAAVIARGPARERILADRGAESMYVSGLLQAAALEVVTQPGWRTHQRGLRDQLQARRDLLASAVREHAARRPPSSTSRRAA